MAGEEEQHVRARVSEQALGARRARGVPVGQHAQQILGSHRGLGFRVI